MGKTASLTQSNETAHGLDQFRRSVADNHNQLRDFPRRERSPLVELAEKFRTIRRGDMDGLERRETCFHEQLHFALVAESGDDTAVAGWVESREQQSARLNER